MGGTAIPASSSIFYWRAGGRETSCMGNSVRRVVRYVVRCSKSTYWLILTLASSELSYLKFSTSLLTACALIFGIVDTLILKARVDSTAPLQNRTERWRSRRGARCDCAQMRKAAQKKVKDVECDIREVLGVKTVRSLISFSASYLII